jgi:H+-transporting ATPase
LGLGLDALRTVAFIAIVFGNQATTYTNRGRQRIGSARPSLWLLGSSSVDVLIAVVLAVCGIAMAPLGLSAVASIFLAAVAFALILILAKVPVFRRLKIA